MSVCGVCGRSSDTVQVHFCSSYGDYLCSKHKNQWRRKGTINDVKPAHVCDVCGISSGAGVKVHWCSKANLFLCLKHRSQFDRLGTFLRRTKRDGNEFVSYEDHAEIVFRDADENIVGVCYIDNTDVERCSKHKWMLTEMEGNTQYVKAIIDGVNTGLHRFILGAQRGDIVDHINRNGLDNRKQNLRIVSASENSVNSRTRSATGEKNIYRKGESFQVQIIRQYKTVYIKSFATLEEATRARNEFIVAYNKTHGRCV